MELSNILLGQILRNVRYSDTYLYLMVDNTNDPDILTATEVRYGYLSIDS
jgi:hypothetical protein